MQPFAQDLMRGHFHIPRIPMSLGAVNILRQPPEGGVSQKLTIAEEGGCGSEKFSTKGFYVNKNVDR